MLSVMPRGRWFAATLVVAVAAAIGVVSLKTGNGSGDFVALITAANGLPRRPILARITAGLAYHMPEAAARRSSNAATKLRLYRAAAALEKNAGRQRGASTLYELGIAQLLIGVPGPAVRSLEEALLAETRERELIDAIHSSANPRLLTDLAAAHYELGRQTGNEDPHIAVEAAQRAWTLSKTPVTAWNRALAVENMHVSELTRAAWSDYLALDARSAWASEARTRDAAARRITLFDQWMSVRKTLLPLAQRGADGSIAAIAVKFPQYARVQVEDHILPEWGRAELRGDELRAADQLHLAAAIATALRIYSGDTTLSDAVDAIHGSVGVRRRALADGYALFGDGRRLIQAQEIAQAAASFETAEKRARVARAPLADHAAYQRGVCLFMRNDYAAAGAMAERVEKSISHSQSRLSLHARIAYFRGLVKIQMGDPDGALALYREATHDYEAAREYDSVALISGRIADALDHVGEVDEASIVRMRSLSILDGVGESARRDPILFDAADVALTRGWYETAQLLFTPIAEPAGQQPMWRCGALLARSSAYAAAEEHEAAVRDYKRARSACDAVPDADVRERVLASAPILMTESSDGRVQDISKSIEFLNRTKNRIWLPEMYRRLGKMYAAAGDRKRAESAYRAGIEVGHQIAATVTDPMQRESFQSHVEALFASLVGSLIGRGDFLEALQVAERGRGQSQRQSGTDIAAVSRSLRDDVAIVDLKWTPQALAGWVITSKGVTPFITSIDSLSFGAIVSRCRSNPGCVEADRRQLYDFVVRPWVDEVRHCCQTAVLVVDGDLDALPFGALEDRRSGRPLVQDFAVATAPSIETVLQSGSAYARRSLEPERVVLVGPPAHDALRHPNLAALDSAKDEVRWLRHQYKGAEEVAGTEATKNRFLAAAREATLLQYSGHAIAVAIPAASSALVLAPETKSQPDDLLYVRDLYAVRFPRLRLAVLAACSTAARNSRTKSGSASIARGFLASGVPIVVGTLWPVDDTVANAFTRALHRELKAGKDPVLAVRGAQLALLTSATPEFRKLSSWAAFTACGAGDVLKTKGREHA